MSVNQLISYYNVVQWIPITLYFWLSAVHEFNLGI